MTNEEILDAISKLQYVVSRREGDDNDEIITSANTQIKVLMAKLDFEEKDKPSPPTKSDADKVLDYFNSFNSSVIGKGVQQATNGVQQQSEREMALINHNLQLESFAKGLQTEKDALEKQLNEYIVKVQNGELVGKSYLDWERKCASQNADIMFEICHNQWYSRFVNLDKIKREIALEKAINEKM